VKQPGGATMRARPPYRAIRGAGATKRFQARFNSSTPASDLILFNRFEKRAEVAFADALIALPLDDFEENRGLECR
jgi:hypothetical protein